MTQYFVDTNIFLRFLLNDDEDQFEKSKKYFESVKRGEIVLILTSFVVFELIFALVNKYKRDRKEVINFLGSILALPYIKLEEPQVIQNAVVFYFNNRLDFVDCYLLAKADYHMVEILSFDKDFKKFDKKK